MARGQSGLFRTWLALSVLWVVFYSGLTAYFFFTEGVDLVVLAFMIAYTIGVPIAALLLGLAGLWVMKESRE